MRLNGRVFELFAELDLLRVEAVEVVPAGELNRRMKGGEGLDEHLAFDVAAARAPGHLRQQLEGPLARAEIRLMQREVGVDDAHQGDVGEMQALGDHLRADEDVDLADAEVAQDAAVILLPLQGIGVHAHGPRVREELGQGGLDLLRAQRRRSGSPGCGTSRSGRPPARARRGAQMWQQSFCSWRW